MDNEASAPVPDLAHRLIAMPDGLDLERALAWRSNLLSKVSSSLLGEALSSVEDYVDRRGVRVGDDIRFAAMATLGGLYQISISPNGREAERSLEVWRLEDRSDAEPVLCLKASYDALRTRSVELPPGSETYPRIDDAWRLGQLSTFLRSLSTRVERWTATAVEWDPIGRIVERDGGLPGPCLATLVRHMGDGVARVAFHDLHEIAAPLFDAAPDELSSTDDGIVLRRGAGDRIEFVEKGAHLFSIRSGTWYEEGRRPSRSFVIQDGIMGRGEVAVRHDGFSEATDGLISDDVLRTLSRSMEHLREMVRETTPSISP